jgi:hypothetical protein
MGMSARMANGTRNGHEVVMGAKRRSRGVMGHIAPGLEALVVRASIAGYFVEHAQHVSSEQVDPRQIFLLVCGIGRGTRMRTVGIAEMGVRRSARSCWALRLLESVVGVEELRDEVVEGSTTCNGERESHEAHLIPQLPPQLDCFGSAGVRLSVQLLDDESSNILQLPQ